MTKDSIGKGGFHDINMKKRILGKGGFGCASLITGIGYWKISRIANGWIKPSEDELASINSFLTASDLKIQKAVNSFRYGR